MEPKRKKKNSQNCQQRIRCVYHAINWNVELWTEPNFLFCINYFYIFRLVVYIFRIFTASETLARRRRQRRNDVDNGHNGFIHDFKWNARLPCTVYAYRRNVSTTMERKRWMTTQNHSGKKNTAATDNVTSIALTLVLYMKFGVKRCGVGVFFLVIFLDVSFIHQWTLLDETNN